MGTSRPASPAVAQLVEDLERLGVTVGVEAVRYWGKLGLAPRPQRRSLGHGRGTLSEYPENAVEQYAAVATVMRRGLPWHIAVVVLVGRGHLPTEEAALREAFARFFAVDDIGEEDPLDYAESAASRAARDRRFSGLLHTMGGNFQRAKLKDPVTGTEISLEQGIQSVLTHMALIGHGQPAMDSEAGMYVAAAQGLLANVPEDRREAVGALVATIYEQLRFADLADIAARADPAELQRAVLDAQKIVALLPPGWLPDLPSGMLDVLTAVGGLTILSLVDGGFDRIVAQHRSALEVLGRAFGLDDAEQSRPDQPGGREVLAPAPSHSDEGSTSNIWLADETPAASAGGQVPAQRV